LAGEREGTRGWERASGMRSLPGRRERVCGTYRDEGLLACLSHSCTGHLSRACVALVGKIAGNGEADGEASAKDDTEDDADDRERSARRLLRVLFQGLHG
jgi:hypothetical protein